MKAIKSKQLKTYQLRFTVSDDTMATEGRGLFFKFLGRTSAISANFAYNVLENPSRALKSGSKVGNTAETKSS